MTSETPQADSQSEEPPTQFSLFSLFLLVTALCALLSWLAPSNDRFPGLLTVTLRQFDPLFRHPDDWKHIAGFLTLFYTVPIIAIVGAIIVDGRSLSRFPTEPGHWLLIMFGVTLLERAATLGLLCFAGYRNSFPWPIALYSWMLPWLAGAIISFRASRALSCEGWKHAFWLLGSCRMGMVAVVFLLNLLPNVGPSLLAIALGGIIGKVIIADAYSDRKIRYSLLHHVGVFCFFEDAVLVSIALIQK